MPSASAPRSGTASGLPDLSNTAIAFRDKSNTDLWRATWLFRIIGNQTISRTGQAFTKMAMVLHLPTFR